MAPDNTSPDAAEETTERTPQVLPQELPVFPLTGVLLLPGARLPLNIFEPRYLNMVEDALGNGRFIGMVQPRDTDRESPDGEPPVYSVGCVGRIISFSETGDGRFTITLTGICRFAIQEELSPVNGYRLVIPDYRPYIGDLDAEPAGLLDRETLLRVVHDYFETAGVEADWKTVENADDNALVTTLSMLCPFAPNERQALLECNTIAERGEMLANLMTIALHEAGNDGMVRH